MTTPGLNTTEEEDLASFEKIQADFEKFEAKTNHFSNFWLFRTTRTSRS
jgi:hypothetical protein